ncbi:BcNRPS1, nonribosomal peptide synthetase [Byssothecium circinans]|uniref:BcNRPS1, nonribosomal peptide synthetase n=1 Tax=Byssothecium circinans TaxID=147558 RepID=A0A6A5TAX4_9PLEO|nr:BcNRPS1, nonribosomal peptide synthetase [Byssothecium circinans]
MELHSNASIVAQAISTVLGIKINPIKCTANFVELGGDSLSAILISAECQKLGVAIPAGIFLQKRTIDEAIANAVRSVPPPIPLASRIPSDHLEDITIWKNNRPENNGRTPSTGISAKDVLDKVDTSRFTELQLLLLRGSLNNPGLNMVTLQETYSGWDIRIVRKAWTSVILIEPIFVDLIRELGVTPQQFLLWQESQANTTAGFEKEVANAVNASDSISRIAVIQSLGDEKKITVVWRIHHSFIDGYSARILLDKITHSLHREAVAPGASFAQTISYLRTFQDKRREYTKCFWDRKREQYPAATSQLRLSPHTAVKKGDISQDYITIQFPDDQLAAATGRTGYTRAVYFAAAWALTLGKFMDADQTSFGLVLSGRDVCIPGAFDTVGPLMNILPLFASVKNYEGSWHNFLRRIHDGILELDDVQHSEAADGFDRQFHSIMATQFECDREPSKAAMPENQDRSHMQSGVPLNLIIEQKSRVQMLYSTAHYTEEDVLHIRAIFQHNMESLLRDDPRLHHTLPSDMENQIRQWSNCGAEESFDSSKGDDLLTLFENIVARQPNDVAIIQGDFQMSYNAFDQAASGVARELSRIRPNEPVCVFADRSVNWLVAIFGILKAGGVYAALDPSAPPAVRQANFKRSGARTLLIPAYASWSASLQLQDDTASFQCLVVEEILMDSKTRGCTEYKRRRIARPDDLAYICFTSGSTGRSKAVQCTHKGLVAFQKNRDVRLAAGRGVVIAQVMSPVFDGSIHEIFSALTYGATLRLPSSDQEEPFSHLQQSHSAILTPSIARALCPDQYPQLRHVYLVGEAVPQAVCDTWGADRLLFNMYGPTEATCGATIKQLLPNQAVSLGHPNPSSRVYILDRDQHLLPPGAVGEIYLAGIQVSQGYISLPDENNDRFLEDSLLPQAKQRMYKTGDFGYWDSVTGEIVLLGRKDRQIKLRGFRLDLDDLEARVVKAIPRCEGVGIFRRDDYLMAAYLAPSVSTMSAKSYMRQALPPYAMPRSVLALDKLPLTSAGKLDYRALEKIHADVIDQDPGLPKYTTKTEKVVLDAIHSLMDLDAGVEVDQMSDLMMLGADSILQLKLANYISTFFAQRFTVRTIIENPVVSALASVIHAEVERKGTADQLRRPIGNTTLGETGISPIELDWFNKYKKCLGTSSFNVSHVSRLDAAFNQHEKLVRAWNTVLARHLILRSRFQESDLGVLRAYAIKAPTAQYLHVFDVGEEINRELHLGTEDPIRVLISQDHMLVCISHIVCDFTTLNRLFEEFRGEYFNHSLSIPKRRYQDTDWNIEIPQTTADFWTDYLSDIDLFVMPCMKACRTSYTGNSLLLRLSEGTMANLRWVSRSWALTMHQIALAIVSIALQARSSTKEDMLLGSPYLGRQDDDMHTVGLFLQPLPIRIRYSDEKAPVRTFLKTVQQSSQSALSHGIDWNALMKLLANSDNDDLRTAATIPAPNHPLFNTMVTFHELGYSQSTDIAGIEPVVSWAEGSKFAIMFEFSSVSASEVTLRIEYDSALFSREEVCSLATRIDAGIEFICKDPSVGELAQSLLEVEQRGLQEVEFGTPIASLS